jgi:hypothetical protein
MTSYCPLGYPVPLPVLQGLEICITSNSSVVDPDPGSGAFLPPGSGSGMNFFRIPDLKGMFLVRFSQESLFFNFFANKTCSWNFKKQEKSCFYFSSLFLCTVGSGIRCFFTPRIRYPDPGWSNGRIRIRDKPSRIRNTASKHCLSRKSRNLWQSMGWGEGQL